ncbi:hypothetical protein J6590_007714 [Homalodisca vitripennis]|nr:hypothetical protein J6590_007714 [Homalodisca vitripennis]
MSVILYELHADILNVVREITVKFSEIKKADWECRWRSGLTLNLRYLPSLRVTFLLGSDGNHNDPREDYGSPILKLSLIYGPVSVVGIVPKILEKVVYTSCYKRVVYLIPPHHNGFIKNGSTTEIMFLTLKSCRMTKNV